MEFEDSYWLYYQRGLDARGDLTKSRKLGRNELKVLFRRYGRKLLYIRNVYNFDCQKETSFWYVVRDVALSPNEYRTSKLRGQIKKSLTEYDSRRVGIDEMRRGGDGVFYENWLRFPEKSRPNLESREEFERSLAVQEARGAEFWIGYSVETGEAATWASVYVVDNMVYGERVRLSYKYVKNYATYGLYHVLTSYYLGERGLCYYIAGARTATSHSHVQDFLIEKMQFRKAYAGLQVPIRFPYSLVVSLLLPFRNAFSSTSKIGALLRLKSYES